ncbi:hypothetical protein Ddye_006038 [Dipteronia dyeriana]|uniref:Uncharacterized protein n=1 Tax=Dipteronia dyeriana TaxID=168575 RepID=A0AAD9XH99_9ROSI|nr:hypothetical protein Ddye_006038 [Dipteronia dyeriana]
MKKIKRESKQDYPPDLSNYIEFGLQVFDEIRHQDIKEEFLPWTLCFDWNKNLRLAPKSFVMHLHGKFILSRSLQKYIFFLMHNFTLQDAAGCFSQNTTSFSCTLP